MNKGLIKIVYVITILAISANSCANAKTVSTNNIGNEGDTLVFPAKANSIYTIRRNIDLKGKTYIMPVGVTIKIQKGVIMNGTLIGKGTKIEGMQPVFDKVTIKGDWNVPKISTVLFKNLNYDNSLRDVMSLTNKNLSNTVEIKKGIYYIHLSKNEETGIYIHSNTSVVLDGEIRLRPNGFTNYSIVGINGRNSSIKGSGEIIGDKKTHTGKAGEWGMGVEFSASCNASVSGITIRDCWGDCIYVGGESKNITISNCTLDNGRRQGISITSADSVWVKDCIISNVSGTAPQYAIDIEPNANQVVSNVTVRNVRAINCVGGFEVWGKASNAKVMNVVFSNCSSSGTTAKYPFLIMTAENVSIENCNVDSDSDYSVLAQRISSLKARDNTFKSKGRKPLNVLQCKRVEISNNQNIIK